MTRRPKPLPRVVLLGAAGWVHAHGALLARQATVAITALAAEVTCVGWKSACAAGTLAAHEATRAGRVAGKCAAGSWRWLATRETRVPGGRRIPPPIVGEGHLFPRPGSGHRGTGAGPLGLTLFQRLRLRRRNSLALRKHEQRVPGPTVATVKRAKLHLGGIRCAAGLPLASWRIAAPRNHVYHSLRIGATSQRIRGRYEGDRDVRRSILSRLLKTRQMQCALPLTVWAIEILKQNDKYTAVGFMK